jgi:hypothetical protein
MYEPETEGIFKLLARMPEPITANLAIENEDRTAIVRTWIMRIESETKDDSLRSRAVNRPNVHITPSVAQYVLMILN